MLGQANISSNLAVVLSVEEDIFLAGEDLNNGQDMVSKYALRANRHAQFLLSEYTEHPRPPAAPRQCQ